METKEMSFFFCSKNIIDAVPECVHSKWFKSGFPLDNEEYCIAILNFEKVEYTN
jgi:hypothetical protein